MPKTTPSPIASVLLVCREPLTNTPFVLPRSSTASSPSALMATAACSRDRLGSSITKSACGDRPMVFRSPQTRIIDGRCGSVGAGRRHALFTRPLRNPLRMRVDIEAAAAGEAHQRDADLPGELHGET